MAMLDAALASFSESDLSVRVCSAIFTVVPTGTRYAYYRTLEQAEEIRAPGRPASKAQQARRLAEGPPYVQVLRLLETLDKFDVGIAAYAGVKNFLALLSTHYTQRRTFESDKPQALDAGVKALAVAYAAGRLFPGGPADKVRALWSLPAGREALAYFAAAEVALPFTDNLIESGAGALRGLMEQAGGGAAGRLAPILGAGGVAEAQAVVGPLVETQASMLTTIKERLPQLTESLRAAAPRALSAADSVTGVLATAVDALPVWSLLGARLVAEASLRASGVQFGEVSS